MGGQQPVVHLLGILVGNGRVCKKPPVHDQRGQRNAKGLTESGKACQVLLGDGAMQQPDVELCPWCVLYGGGKHGLKRGNVIGVKGYEQVDGLV